MGRFSNQTALVTGGASGIGEACVRRFIADGGQAVILDLDEVRASALIKELGDKVLFRKHDVTLEQDWIDSTQWATETFGTWQVLINSAGISVPSSVEDCDIELWQKTQKINSEGVFLGCKHAIAAMKNFNTPCSIVNISSSYGIRAGGDMIAYSASKSSVMSMTESMALHCAQSDYTIRCNAVNPGAIHTPMMDYYLNMAEDKDAMLQIFANNHPMKRVGQPEEVANAILFLASDEAAYITGVSLPVDGGYCAM